MGSFIANFQVYAGSGAAEQVRLGLVEAMRRIVLSGPFVEVTKGGEAADREILVAPPGTKPWIAVYDEFIEDQDLGRMTEIAEQLSVATHTYVLAVAVHDSDVLNLRLAREGKIIDMYSSRPDFFGPTNFGKRRELKGNVEAWKELLADGLTTKELRAAFDEKLLFADDTLLRIAEMLRLDPDWVTTSWGYLAPQPLERGTTRLAFRSTAPRESLPPDVPPAFALAAHTDRLEYSAGDQFKLTASVTNTGGQSKGAMVAVWGDVLDEGLVELENVQLWSLNAGRTAERTELTLEEHTVQSKNVRFGRADGLYIPAGVSMTDRMILPSLEVFDAWLGTQIHAHLTGTTRRPGRGAIHIGFVPLANRERGQAEATTIVEVFPAARRPLRYQPPGKSEFLRAMETPRYLVALAALGADRKTCADVAGDAFEKWHSIISPQRKGIYHMVFHPEQRLRPSIRQLAAKNIPLSKRWHHYRKAFETCESLYAQLARDKEGDNWFTRGSGFSFDASSVFFQKGGDELVPHIGLWLELGDIDAHPMGKVTAQLAALVDEVMQQAKGISAFVARWDWASYSASMTPYEIACEVHGQCTTGRWWCSRYLRGVSEQVWLGAELLERLGDLGAIQSVAQITGLGTGVRLTLNQSAKLDDLELALAPLVPSHDDWIAGTRKLYRQSAESSDQGIP